MVISPEQCRAARSLLGWSQTDLMKAAGLTQATLSAFEKGSGAMRTNNNERLQEALEGAGVVFIEDGETSKAGGAGVRLK